MENSPRVKPSILKMQIEQLQKENVELKGNLEHQKALDVVNRQMLVKAQTKIDTLITFVKSLEEM